MVDRINWVLARSEKMKRKGFSLIEVLVALFIVTLLVLGFSSLSYATTKARYSNKVAQEALIHAENVMETILGAPRDIAVTSSYQEYQPGLAGDFIIEYRLTVENELIQPQAQVTVAKLYIVEVRVTKDGKEIQKLYTKFYVFEGDETVTNN